MAEEDTTAEGISTLPARRLVVASMQILPKLNDSTETRRGTRGRQRRNLSDNHPPHLDLAVSQYASEGRDPKLGVQLEVTLKPQQPDTGMLKQLYAFYKVDGADHVLKGRGGRVKEAGITTSSTAGSTLGRSRGVTSAIKFDIEKAGKHPLTLDPIIGADEAILPEFTGYLIPIPSAVTISASFDLDIEVKEYDKPLNITIMLMQRWKSGFLIWDGFDNRPVYKSKTQVRTFRPRAMVELSFDGDAVATVEWVPTLPSTRTSIDDYEDATEGESLVSVEDPGISSG
ncbi:hypothetical protein PYCC9005_004926 [Savitreella phatthalungensis]